MLVELRDLTTAFRKLSVDYSTLQASISHFMPDADTRNEMHDDKSMRKDPPMETGKEVWRELTKQDKKQLSARNKALSALSICSCVCHRAVAVQTPRVAQQVLGTLSIKLHGLPAMTATCNEIGCRGCQDSACKVTYRFPSWLLSRAVN